MSTTQPRPLGATQQPQNSPATDLQSRGGLPRPGTTQDGHQGAGIQDAVAQFSTPLQSATTPPTDPRSAAGPARPVTDSDDELRALLRDYVDAHKAVARADAHRLRILSAAVDLTMARVNAERAENRRTGTGTGTGTSDSRVLDWQLQSVIGGLAVATKSGDFRLMQEAADASLLVTDFPTAVTTLEDGAIEARHLRAFTKHHHLLDPEQRPSFATDVLAYARDHTAPQTVKYAGKLAATLSKDRFEETLAEERDRRSVRLIDHDNGMSTVAACLPNEIAIPVYDLLTKQAKALKDANIREADDHRQAALTAKRAAADRDVQRAQLPLALDAGTASSPTPGDAASAADAGVGTADTDSAAGAGVSPALGSASALPGTGVTGTGPGSANPLPGTSVTGTGTGPGSASPSADTIGTASAGADGAAGAAGAAGAGDFVADERTMDQLRADLFADTLLTATPQSILQSDTAGAKRIHTVLNVTVPMLSLLESTDEDRELFRNDPALLNGVQPMSHDQARQLASDASSVYRVLTDPVTGHAVTVDNRQADARLRKFLQVHDRHCRFPGCRRPAVDCDLDHNTPWSEGGPSAQCNLCHLCTSHHTQKHESGWQVKRLAGGVIQWTTPLGQILRYTTDPHGPIFKRKETERQTDTFGDPTKFGSPTELAEASQPRGSATWSASTAASANASTPNAEGRPPRRAYGWWNPTDATPTNQDDDPAPF